MTDNENRVADIVTTESDEDQPEATIEHLIRPSSPFDLDTRPEMFSSQYVWNHYDANWVLKAPPVPEVR